MYCSFGKPPPICGLGFPLFHEGIHSKVPLGSLSEPQSQWFPKGKSGHWILSCRSKHHPIITCLFLWEATSYFQVMFLSWVSVLWDMCSWCYWSSGTATAAGYKAVFQCQVWSKCALAHCAVQYSQQSHLHFTVKFREVMWPAVVSSFVHVWGYLKIIPACTYDFLSLWLNECVSGLVA